MQLADRRRFPGRVIGKDTRADLAVVKVEGATDLAALAFGDSDGVRVGELVLALGHPFGLERAVSFGIVSRKGTLPTGGVPGFDFIQTDASANPANLGGPLVKSLLPQLVANGRVEWGWLGVNISEVRHEDLERLNELWGGRSREGLDLPRAHIRGFPPFGSGDHPVARFSFGARLSLWKQHGPHAAGLPAPTRQGVGRREALRGFPLFDSVVPPIPTAGPTSLSSMP